MQNKPGPGGPGADLNKENTMKKSPLLRCAALGTATLLTVALTGCGEDASSAATAETAGSASSVAEATDETAEDAYGYLADFSYSAPLDGNGYFTNVKASDYVTLPDGYDKMTMPSGTDQYSDEDLELYIRDNILATYAVTTEVTDRAAALGDTVNIDYVGSVDGVEFSGGNTQGSGADLLLGSGSYIDDFEDQIVGHIPGETFNVEVTFPEDYGNEELNGKDAVFVTTLNYISEEVLPELTDEWVVENLQENTGFTTAEEFRTRIRSDLIYDNECNELYDQLIDNVQFAEAMPVEVTDYYTDLTLLSAYSYASAYGMDLESFLAAMGYGSVDGYITAAQSAIESSVHQAVLLQAIAEQKSITCDDTTMEGMLSRYFGTNGDQYLELYGEPYVKMNMLHDLVMEDLIANADVAAA